MKTTFRIQLWALLVAGLATATLMTGLPAASAQTAPQPTPINGGVTASVRAVRTERNKQVYPLPPEVQAEVNQMNNWTDADWAKWEQGGACQAKREQYNQLVPNLIADVAGHPCVLETFTAIEDAVHRFLPPELWTAYLRCAFTISTRESRLLPWASNSAGARGLFQQMIQLWSYNVGRFNAINDPPIAGDPLNAYDNAMLSIWEMVHDGMRPWTPVPPACSGL
jgi:hypothetical protein